MSSPQPATVSNLKIHTKLHRDFYAMNLAQHGLDLALTKNEFEKRLMAVFESDLILNEPACTPSVKEITLLMNHSGLKISVTHKSKDVASAESKDVTSAKSKVVTISDVLWQLYQWLRTDGKLSSLNQYTWVVGMEDRDCEDKEEGEINSEDEEEGEIPSPRDDTGVPHWDVIMMPTPVY